MNIKRDKLIAAAPLVLFGLLVLALVVGLHRGAPSGASPRHVGDLVPVTNLPVLGQSSMRFTTASMHGRPYVVNFFASWSEESKTEHEELMTLAATHVALIGITYKDNIDNATGFLDRAGNPFNVVAQDDDGHAAASWGVTVAPETFVVDTKGVIRWHHSGPLTARIASDELMPAWENVSRGN